MSTTIDERVVKMDFDDSGFEAGANEAIATLGKLEGALNLEGASSGLDSIRQSMSNFDVSGVTSGVEQIKSSFSILNTFITGVIGGWGRKVADAAWDMAKNSVKELTKPMKDGFVEYEQQMKSVQTISANSGESLDVIQKNLDELNLYADKTTYVFSDMTSAIGRFTAAGIGVEDSTNAIQGFFNAAALAGADASSASRGVYQLSQAMSAGVVKLQDWKSIESASIDTQSFRDIIKITAEQMGVATDKFKSFKNGEMAFRESLSDGWLTADVMQKALENLTMSTMDYADAEEGAAELTKKLLSEGYTEEQAKQIIGIATAADQSAREVRTWSQMMDTIGESMGSGWAETWRLIIGDYEESAQFFTWLSDKFGGIISASADARNRLLKDWHESGGRDALIGIIANSIEAIERIVTPVVDALGEVFKITGEQLAVLTENIAYFTEGLVVGGDDMNFVNSLFFDLATIAKSILGVFGNLIRIVGTLGGAIARLLAPILSVVANAFASVVGIVANVSSSLHVLSDGIEETFGSFISELVEPIEYLITYAIDFASDLRDAFLWAFPKTELGERISGIKDSIVGFLSELGVVDKVKSAFSSFLDPLKTFVETLKDKGTDGRLGRFKRFFIETARAIERQFSPAIGAVKSGFLGLKDLLTPVIGAFKSLYEWIKSLDFGWLSGIKDFFVGGFSSALEAISNFRIPNIGAFFSDLFSGFGNWDFLKNMIERDEFGSIVGVMIDAGDGIDGFRYRMLSALEAFRSFGEELYRSVREKVVSFIESLSDGSVIVDTFGTVFEKISSVAGIAAGSISDFAQNLSSNVRDKVVELKDRFVDLITNADLSTESVKNFVISLGTKIKTRGGGFLTNVVETLSGAFHKFLDYVKTFKGKNIAEIIGTIFRDIYERIRQWLERIQQKTDGFGSILAGFAIKVVDAIQNVPGKLAAMFGSATSEVGEGVSELNSFAENAEKFWSGLFEKISNFQFPDISEIISNFVTGLKQKLTGEIEGEMGGDIIQSTSFAGIFDLTNFEFQLPDWSTPATNFVKQFSKILETVPDNRIDELVGKFSGWAKTIGGIAFAFSGWKWLGSLTKLNEGMATKGFAMADWLNNMPVNAEAILANFGKNFASGLFGPIQTGLTNIGKSITTFGKTFDPLGKKSKGKQFAQIASGILLLAGALLVISKIPADDLERSAEAILKLGAVTLIMMGVMALFSKLAKVDFTGVGAAFAGVGIGLLAISAALWVLGQFLNNPDMDADAVMSKLMELFAALVLAVAIIGLTTKNSSMTGTAAALIALVVAITLALAPLWLLSKMSDSTFLDGIYKLVILGAILALYAGVVSAMSSLGGGIGASVAMLSLVAALTLALIPLYLISNMPKELFDSAIENLVWLGLLIVGLTGIVGFVGSIVGLGMGIGVAGMLAVVTILTLALIPLGIMAAIPKPLFNSAIQKLQDLGGTLLLIELLAGLVGTMLPGLAIGLLGMAAIVGILTLALIPLGIMAAIPDSLFGGGITKLIEVGLFLTVFAALIGFVGTAFPGLSIAVASLAALVGIVGIMTGLTVALGYIVDQHPEYMVNAISALVTIGIMLAALGMVGFIGGAGMMVLGAGAIVLAGGLLILSAAVAVIKAVIGTSDFISNLFASFESAGQYITDGLIGGLSAGASSVFNTILSIAQGLWNAFAFFLGINSPSTVFEEGGENVVDGLLNGLTGGEGEVFDASSLLGDGAIGGFLESIGLHLDEVEGVGEEGSTSFLDQFESLPSQLGEKASGALQEFLDNIDTEELKQKGTDMISGLLAGIGENLSERLHEKASEVFDSFTSPIKEFFGIHSPSTYMQNEIGLNIIEGLIQGLSNLGGLGEAALELGSAIIDGVSNLPSTLGELGGNAVSWFSNAFSGGRGKVASESSKLGSGATEGIKGLDTKLKTSAEDAISKFSDAFSKSKASVSTQMTALVTSSVSAAKPLESKLKAEAVKAMNGFAAAIKASSGAAKNAINSVISTTSGAGKSLYNKFYDVGRNVVRGLINGIDSLIDKARSKANQLMTIVEKTAKAAAKIKSPSRVFMEIGEYLVDGLIIGIDNLMDDAADAGSSLSDTVVNSFGDSLNTMSISMDDLLDADYNPVITPVINPAEFNSNLNRLTAMMNSQLSSGLDVGAVNYNETFAGKLDAMADFNKQAMQQFAENAIDYDRLGVSVANALIRSGVHVEMDGGQLMGYIAGEIRDVRRQYA